MSRGAIYLDADMLVRRNLGDLWDENQGGHAVLAVQDVAAPCFDASASLPTFERCRQHLCAHTPIANYRELGLPPDGKYFNGGMLVVDLAQWRREHLAEKMLDCLRLHRQHVLWWDQYALNVVLARKWRALDHRWNQGAHLYVYPNWRQSPFDRETFAQLRNAPWIVHFCSPSKPWHYFCRHPFRREFFRCLEQTDWKNWRPERPDQFLKQWWDYHYLPLRSQVKANIRVIKHAIRSARRLRRLARELSTLPASAKTPSSLSGRVAHQGRSHGLHKIIDLATRFLILHAAGSYHTNLREIESWHVRCASPDGHCSP